MPDGIVIINKPRDWTSMDVCAKLRGILHEKRVGHSGTLDPMATGVLPVFVGQATKAVRFAEGGKKEYLAGLRLGLVTDTQDVTGTVLERRDAAVSPDALREALPHFTGEISQLPPMYSAIKINGRKLCDLARKGQEVERSPRPVTIFALELLEQTGPGDYTLRCVCSKGTYIRTLCHDLGAYLGCGGVMSSLCRTQAAGFSLEQAVTLEEVQARGAAALLPTDSLFAAYPVLLLQSEQAETRVRHGNPIADPAVPDGTYRVCGLDGTFLCLSRAQGGTLTSLRNFFET
ncbi:MAG: tRNA pseudouridine(55) synthase TruB [Oscillibacter sp.]|jgi:tRNA pseudouridine55 synthase|nr:tRNA pseudouridine(55) synthase TruB [Oscillibacter sp.]